MHKLAFLLAITVAPLGGQQTPIPHTRIPQTAIEEGFSHFYNLEYDQAIAVFDKAIAQTPDAFWIYYQKANCLAKLGKKQDAMTASNKSVELAKAAKNDDYVALNTKLQASLK